MKQTTPLDKQTSEGFTLYDLRGSWATKEVMMALLKGLNKKLISEKQLCYEEGVKKAFDWIWKGWNLDLSKKDRAIKHFINKLTPKE